MLWIYNEQWWNIFSLVLDLPIFNQLKKLILGKYQWTGRTCSLFLYNPIYALLILYDFLLISKFLFLLQFSSSRCSLEVTLFVRYSLNYHLTNFPLSSLLKSILSIYYSVSACIILVTRLLSNNLSIKFWLLVID